jgi:hypothetical protein
LTHIPQPTCALLQNSHHGLFHYNKIFLAILFTETAKKQRTVLKYSTIFEGTQAILGVNTNTAASQNLLV